MKTKLTITASLIFLCSMLFGQGQLPPWLIEWAPDSSYVLISGPGGIYNHRLLSSLGLGGDSEANSNFPCQDTIVQASHGFSLGDLIGQSPNNGPYFVGNVGVPDSIPVWFVCSVISADSFTIASTGTIDWTHGKLPGRDYFAQDASGDLDTIPDADYTFFGFRTIGTNRAAFDIPELVVDGSSGGGGSSYSTTASNGLNDQDGGTDVDVELGGTLDKNTTVETDGFNLQMGDNTGNDLSYIRTSAANTITLYARDNTTSKESEVSVLETGTVISTNEGTPGTFAQVDVSEQSFTSVVSTGGTTQTQFIQGTTTFTMLGIPAYADDAAAGAGGLITGQLYQTTGTALPPLNVAGILMIKQ